ncbi:MAG: chemotaxis protein CheA [Phycisphaerae bacterium]
MGKLAELLNGLERSLASADLGDLPLLAEAHTSWEQIDAQAKASAGSAEMIASLGELSAKGRGILEQLILAETTDAAADLATLNGLARQARELLGQTPHIEGAGSQADAEPTEPADADAAVAITGPTDGDGEPSFAIWSDTPAQADGADPHAVAHRNGAAATEAEHVVVFPAPPPPPAFSPGPAQPQAASKPATKPAAMTALAPAAPLEEPPPHLLVEDDVPLLTEFIGEAASHLEIAEQEILKLEDHPDDFEAIGALFRAFHTIKGVAGFLNLQQIQNLSHAAENLLDRGREGKLAVTGTAADLVLESIDLMKRLIWRLDDAAKAMTPLDSLPGVADLAHRLETYVNAVEEGVVPDVVAMPPSALSGRMTDDQDGAPADAVVGEAGADVAGEEAPAAPGVVNFGRRAEDAPAKQNSTDGTVKVQTDRLDRLINMVGELVISNAMVAQDLSGMVEDNQRLGRNVGQMGKIVRELQELSMSLRMVQVGHVFRKMTRLVRDVARKAGKEVELEINGAETELDRNVVDSLGDPLVHMVRNAVDHGIEPAAEREAAGKPRVGRLELRAYHKGGNINIEILDDGRGLNRDKILKKAIANGVVPEGADLPDSEVYKLIFHAGLSTAEKVTDISGRGVGMDVVKQNIEKLRGRVEINSGLGRGSTFTIRLPLTMAVIDGLVVKVGREKFILPITSIEQSIRPTPDQLNTVQGRGETVFVRGAVLPLIRLHNLFGVDPTTRNPAESLVVIVQDNDRRCCLLVDELLGQEQVVIKKLGDEIGQLRGISGGAVLGDGNVSLILDVPGLIELTNE